MLMMIMIYLYLPGYAIYYLLSTKGSWSEVLRQGVTPVIKPRKEAVMAEEKACLTYQDVRDVEMNIDADLSDDSFDSYDSKKCLGEDL